ncbi:MAG: family 43 glycosylhydrolase [Verrucomicrobiota bacterium JB022]|nr:family 43 glycosylhydrolase [Verrucomicrobiota bacterium JB022]
MNSTFSRLLRTLLLPLATSLHAQERPPVPEIGSTLPTNGVIAHDPVMIEQDGTYYLFTTGPGISVWTSTDLKEWTRQPGVFDPFPEWIPVAIPEFQGHLWAPDIYFHDGLYYLYYSASAFGKNTSAIGVATNRTLDRDDPNFKWVDHGKIVQSFPGVTNWNAIDAHIIDDADGTPYMSFGSFWGGLKIAKLMPDRLSLADCWQDLLTIATRVRENENGEEPGANAIEAPFIFHHGDHYYLFASIDYCCRGARSDYKVIVGRSESLLGPYVDREGEPLLDGGGTIILQGDKRWHGVGHNAVYTFDGADYIVSHAYDAEAHGWPKLRIDKIHWTEDGWPEVSAE